MLKIIDLHCDTLTLAYDNGRSLCCDEHHFSLDRLPGGYSWCQCMAVFIPDELRGQAATDYFSAVHDFYRTQLNENKGIFREIKGFFDIAAQMEKSDITAILTVEGGAVLAGDPANVEWLYGKGVRMMTLTWNAENELCGGVLSGGGFTKIGREAVRRMESSGMIVDVSHLSDKGFLQLCDFAEKPFVASHSNARSICPHPRNLTDEMLREIIQCGGLVGLNYYDLFIRDGGGSADIEDLLRHVHHILDLGGEDYLALGSDYDGADLPPYICGMQYIGDFAEALECSGVSPAVVQKLLYKNAAEFFARIL